MVVATTALSSLAALGVVTLTPPVWSATAGLSSQGPSISVLHFLGALKKPVILSPRAVLAY